MPEFVVPQWSSSNVIAALCVYAVAVATAAFVALRTLPRLRLPPSLARVLLAQRLLVGIGVVSATIQIVAYLFADREENGVFYWSWCALSVLDFTTYSTLVNLHMYLALWRILAALPPAWARKANRRIAAAAMVAVYLLPWLGIAGYYLPQLLCVAPRGGTAADPDSCNASYMISAEVLFIAVDLVLAAMYVYSWRRYAHVFGLPNPAGQPGPWLVLLSFLASAAVCGSLIACAVADIEDGTWTSEARILWMVHATIMVLASSKLTSQLSEALAHKARLDGPEAALELGGGSDPAYDAR
ncbi:hypothetical protein H9P43_002138 [Blastocladiella emersonii ATCC 22665]|nr:hypothetical protein H9P43_002138 [Blastocladiella emersonii ATCC 22665]